MNRIRVSRLNANDVHLDPGDNVYYSDGSVVVYLQGDEAELYKLMQKILQTEVNRVIEHVKGKHEDIDRK